MDRSEAEKRPLIPTDAKLKELWPDWNPDDPSFPQPKRPRPSAAKEKTAMELLREEAGKQGVRIVEEEPLPRSGLGEVPDPDNS